MFTEEEQDLPSVNRGPLSVHSRDLIPHQVSLKTHNQLQLHVHVINFHHFYHNLAWVLSHAYTLQVLCLSVKGKTKVCCPIKYRAIKKQLDSNISYHTQLWSIGKMAWKVIPRSGHSWQALNCAVFLIVTLPPTLPIIKVTKGQSGSKLWL